MQWWQIIRMVIEGLDPATKASISASLDTLVEHAKKTKLPLDNIALAIFRFLTGL